MSRNEKIGLAALILFAFLCICAKCQAGEPDQRARWTSAQINPKFSMALDIDVALYRRLAPRYQKITDMRKNGVPAPILFCLHQRESSGSFLCHPHNGDPLTSRTRNVPRGRLPNADPPYDFFTSAEDAYYVVDKLDKIEWTDLQAALQGLESFNGLGVQKYHPGFVTAYLWSATTLYGYGGKSAGKYTSDGKWNGMAVDKQLGACAILKRLQERGIALSWR